MKDYVYKMLLLAIAGVILSVLPTLAQSVEDEVLVLFTSGTMQMPIGKIRATVNEIQAPEKVTGTFEALGVIDIAKGFPTFDSQDTLRVTPDGKVARLPDFSHFYILRLPPGADRDYAIRELEGLPQVIYAEKNQRGYPRQIYPNDDYLISNGISTIPVSLVEHRMPISMLQRPGRSQGEAAQ
jgi:hypothetical protein